MSSRLRQQILSLSQEDEALVEIPVEEGSDSLEGSISEVIAADHEVEEADQAIEEMGEVQESLESIEIALEAALLDGGLDQHGAAMLRIAVESTAIRIGLTDNLPSVESFGGTSDRERATRVSLEGVIETIKKIWAAIVATLKKWAEAVQRFFYKLFSAAPRLISRANALKEKADKTKGSPKADAKLKLSGMAADVAEDRAGLGKAAAMLADVYTDHAKKSEAFGEEVASFLKEVDVESNEKFDSSVTKILSVKFPVPASCNEHGNASDYGVGATHEVKTSAVLPGGKILVAAVGKGERYEGVSGARAYLDKSLSSSKIWMAPAKGHKEREGDLEVKPLERSAVAALAQQALSIGSHVHGYQTRWNGSVSSIKKSISSAGDAYVKKDAEKLTGESASLAKSLPKLAEAGTKGIDSAQRSVGAYAIMVAQAALTVGEKSLKTYTTAKAA